MYDDEITETGEPQWLMTKPPGNERDSGARRVEKQLARLSRQLEELRPKPRRLSTFRVFAEAWFESIKTLRAEPGNERRHVKRLIAALGQLTEETLTAGKIETALVALEKPNGPLGPESINKLISSGGLIIRRAQFERQWDAGNPFEVINRRTVPKRQYETLSPDEWAQVEPFIPEGRARPARVAYFIGIRPGELVASRVEDVDRRRRTLTVRRSHARNTTKTKRERVIPIPDLLWPDFEAAINESASGLLFPGPGGKQFRDDYKWTRMLRWALSLAGIVTGWRQICNAKGCGYKIITPDQKQRMCPHCSRRLLLFPIPRQVRFYDLRHSMVTHSCGVGADPLAIKTTAGHAPRDMTDERYRHLTDEFVRAELNRLPSEVENRTKQHMKQPSAQPDSPPAGSLGSSCSTPELPPRGFSAGVSSTDSLLTVKEVAALLKLSRRFVYDRVKAGLLPVHRFGNEFRFSRADVEAFIQKASSQ